MYRVCTLRPLRREGKAKGARDAKRLVIMPMLIRRETLRPGLRNFPVRLDYVKKDTHFFRQQTIRLFRDS